MEFEARKIRLIMSLRQKGITDTSVLSAIERVPRENFVLSQFTGQAYEDSAWPIEEGQTISEPYVVAFMTQALKNNHDLKVLEIGTGSGYQAAILSKLYRRVFTIERYKSLLRIAEERFHQCKIHNVITRLNDGFNGWPEQAPFDRIIVTAAAESIPPNLKNQLSENGILIIPIGFENRKQQIIRVIKKENTFIEENLLSVRFVPLVKGVVRGNS